MWVFQLNMFLVSNLYVCVSKIWGTLCRKGISLFIVIRLIFVLWDVHIEKHKIDYRVVIYLMKPHQALSLAMTVPIEKFKRSKFSDSKMLKDNKKLKHSCQLDLEPY